MTADGQGEDELRIGVVLEAFLDWPLEQILAWLPAAAPEVTHLEIGAGGYAPHPHCNVAVLLASGQARSAWLADIAGTGLQVDALNAWGNPLHPDRDLAREHDRALRDAIRLAALLGVSRVVALAGCPGGAAGDQVPHFGAGGWLPYLEGVYQRQWEEQIAPYWADLAEFRRRDAVDLRGARPRPRPGLVDGPDPGTRRFGGARHLDRARGSVRARDHRRPRGRAAASRRDRRCAGSAG